MKRISVNLTPEQDAGLKKLAGATGILQSELIRRAIDVRLATVFHLTQERWLDDGISLGLLSKQQAAKIRSGELPMEAALEIVRVAGIEKARHTMPVLFAVNPNKETR